MTAGQSSAPIYRDTRDLTPFRNGKVLTPVRGIAEGVGGLIHGVLGGRGDAALAALKEVLRRRKTSLALRNDALTDLNPDGRATAFTEWFMERKK